MLPCFMGFLLDLVTRSHFQMMFWTFLEGNGDEVEDAGGENTVFNPCEVTLLVLHFPAGLKCQTRLW